MFFVEQTGISEQGDEVADCSRHESKKLQQHGPES